ncbi:right-handed parallel beta-helix repeat-containing protein [Sunxiuqinia sp. sy24]|uniref:right-handed parallel beta-helix repeat-containing protein n=1 Tax=Sunxiuqinia sp. sy24 TaxID=3461495 RepID=UPI0040460369
MRVILLSLLSFFLACTPSLVSSQSKKIYVSLNGTDVGTGTKASPFTSLNKALEVLKDKAGNEQVEILIRGGHYELSEPLEFTSGMSGRKEAPVVIRANGKESVTISGGRAITSWRNEGDNHWIADLPEVKKGNWYFRQLFAGDQRLTRARIPNAGFLKTAGPLSKYKETIRKYTWDAKMKQEDLLNYWGSRCGFRFKDGDIKEWNNWEEAEILTYHSWESSWQTIREIDSDKKDVHFNSPCRYPVGTFGGHMRYRIENIPEALDMPGEWYLDGKKGELHYLAQTGEDPREMNIHAPYLTSILALKGSNENLVEFIEFRNINFKYAAYELGIYDIAPNWPEEIKKGLPEFPDHPRPGYTDSQASPRCGQGVFLEYSKNIRFEKCRFNHFGSNAVTIGKGSREVVFNGCEMFDMGGGGIYIGFPIREVDKAGVPKSDAPSNNTISNCFIHSAGKVHPAAVGVWIAQSYNNTIFHNEISDISYTGVSTGWTWGGGFNYTKSNRIANNYIHHVAQYLGDAAGIYSLGNCEGTAYYENYMDQIAKGDGVHGVVDAMGFDEHSNNIRIERNVVGKISGKVASFNKNKPEDHKWIDNNFNLMVERPVLEHKPGMEASEMTVVVDFEMVSGFLNLQGWTEQRWVMSKNGGQNDDGYIGLVVEGKRITGIMNIGGGKAGRFAITSEDVLIDDAINRAGLSYDGEKMELSLNGKAIGERSINRKRKTGNGKMTIAPIRANSLRNGVEKLRVYSTALSVKETDREENATSFAWEAPDKKIADLNFNQIIERSGPQKKYYKFLKHTKEKQTNF